MLNGTMKTIGHPVTPMVEEWDQKIEEFNEKTGIIKEYL